MGKNEYNHIIIIFICKSCLFVMEDANKKDISLDTVLFFFLRDLIKNTKIDKFDL